MASECPGVIRRPVEDSHDGPIDLLGSDVPQIPRVGRSTDTRVLPHVPLPYIDLVPRHVEIELKVRIAILSR